MKTTLEFLDAIKAKHGLTSDYQLAKHLDCTHSAISNYRSGRSRLGEDEACKVAELLGLEAGYILSCIAAERSKNPRVKKAWEWTAQHLGGIAAALALALILPSVALDNRENAAFSGLDSPALYIMSNELAGIFCAYWLALLPLCLLALRYFPRYSSRPKKQQN